MIINIFMNNPKAKAILASPPYPLLKSVFGMKSNVQNVLPIIIP